MLQLLFQSLEQSLGPYLSEASYFLYLGGFALLACVVVVPVGRVWLDERTRRTGLERRWVMACRNCGKWLIVSGPTCRHCNADLGIPWSVRLWIAPTRQRDGAIRRYLRWIGHLLASALFVLVSIRLLRETGALEPNGSLHRLFLGMVLLSLAAVGWFGGRTVTLSRRGIVARVGDAMVTLAAIGMLAVSVFLAGNAMPVRDLSLARFTTASGLADIGYRTIALANEELGFEYLQLDHKLLGYHRVIPLAFLGTERVPIHRNPLKEAVIDHLREHADAYYRRGLLIRLRSDRLKVAAGRQYEVVDVGGQIVMRRTAEATDGDDKSPPMR